MESYKWKSREELDIEEQLIISKGLRIPASERVKKEIVKKPSRKSAVSKERSDFLLKSLCSKSKDS